MAYRFLLEVPEALAAEANVAVGEAGDAQVVVVRNSHGRSIDDPYLDLTVACHSLRVVHTLAEWYQQLGPSRADIRIVLHSGDRIRLAEHEPSAIVAAIRRDQPWVERTIPKIGEHVVESVAKPREAKRDSQEAPVSAQPPIASTAASAVSPTASSATLERGWSTLAAVQEPDGGRRVAIRELSHIAVQVTEMEKAERFYIGFLGMDLVGRGRRNSGGGLDAVEPNYSWDEAVRAGREADVSFLRNGPLVLALHRAGRGARLERGVLDHVSIRVDAVTFTSLKGQVLMQSMHLVDSAETAFAFRDPFGVTWEITLQTLPDFI
jgi:catechol 2,3-dioxygenase-like lactoylglutathione lyase family enzyme